MTRNWCSRICHVESPGGLFEACSGRFRDEVVASIPAIGHGFADLLVEPDLSALENDTISTAQILEVLKRWSRARLLGPLVTMRRNRILERIANKLYARLCGQRWADAEAAYLDAPHAGFARQKLLAAVGDPQKFSRVSRSRIRPNGGGKRIRSRLVFRCRGALSGIFESGSLRIRPADLRVLRRTCLAWCLRQLCLTRSFRMSNRRRPSFAERGWWRCYARAATPVLYGGSIPEVEMVIEPISREGVLKVSRESLGLSPSTAPADDELLAALLRRAA